MMITFEEDRFRLNIPVSEAILFTIGESDLSYTEPSDELRQLVGLLALDMLEYSEEWRTAALLRAAMRATWPDLFE